MEGKGCNERTEAMKWTSWKRKEEQDEQERRVEAKGRR